MTTEPTTIILSEPIKGSPKQAGSDNHAYVVPGSDLFLIIDTVIDACGASEALKMSNLRNVTIRGIGDKRLIRGGVEEPLDVVRGSNLVFDNLVFEQAAESRQTVTIKGGVRGWTLWGCTGVRKVVLGDYCIYASAGGTDPVSDGCISTPVGEPKPTVICIHAEPPDAGKVNLDLWFYRRCQHANVWVVPKLAVWAYFLVRRKCCKENGVNAGVVAGLTRSP
jgi:hypothetical protein